jgi:hypothetical protein
MLTGLLAVALAALFVQAAAAHQVSQNDNTFAPATVSNSSSTAKAPLVIPYLSHGVGVDMSLYSGTNRHKASGGYYDVVRGVFVPAHEATSATFQRAVNRHEASRGYYDVVRGVFVPAHMATSATSQSPARVGGQKPFVQGSAGRGSQYALMAPTAVRPDNRAGLRGINASDIASQPQATAVRPDDRGGLRGI